MEWQSLFCDSCDFIFDQMWHNLSLSDLVLAVLQYDFIRHAFNWLYSDHNIVGKYILYRVFLACFDDRYSVVFPMPKSMFFSQFE